MKKITWEILAKPAEDIFNIWVGRPELKWAKTAWQKLDERGLTAYEDELEKHRALLRFLTLGAIYHEFCEKAFSEFASVEIIFWLSALEDAGLYISPFRLGQLLGSSFLLDEEILNSDIEQELIPDFVMRLMEQERRLVFSGLRDGFGNESLLFAHLWLSNQTSLEMDDEEDEFVETVDDVLAYATFDKMSAFEWVNEGMPSLEGYYASESYEKPHKESRISEIEDLIAKGESDELEFKSSVCLNPFTHKKDNKMVVNILKTIAAFINSKGGQLLIGVADDGSIEGVNREFEVANPKKKDWDGYELYLADVINKNLDNHITHTYYTIIRHTIGNRDICEVNVKPSLELAYVEEKLYVRNGNQTIEMKGRNLVAYAEKRKSDIFEP